MCKMILSFYFTVIFHYLLFCREEQSDNSLLLMETDRGKDLVKIVCDRHFILSGCSKDIARI